MFTSHSDQFFYVSRLIGLVVGLLLILAGHALAQSREVVSSQIAVSGDEATLRLEFADEGRLQITFLEGSVEVDGETVGSYQRGDALETGWRALLGQAVSLDDGPLAEALRGWEPPPGLEGEKEELADLLDQTLEEALTTSVAEEAQESVRVNVSAGEASPQAVVSALIGRTSRLRDMAEALEGLELDDVQIRVGEDVTVGPEVQLDASLIVVGATVEVEGEVRGNVVVVDGDLHLLEGSRITGDIRLADARLFRNGGVVEGRVRTVRAADEAAASTDAAEIRADIERRLRSELREELRTEIRGATRSAFRNPLRNFLGGLGGLIENIIGFAILSAIGLGVIYFARENLEVVAEAVRREPGRSAVVGLAGSFLLFPVWILGLIALVISIIGIPVAVAWIPLFPLAAGLAAGLGYLAVALVVGDWVGERNIQGLEWIRGANPFYRLVAGVGTLMLAFAAANVAQMGGSWLDFLEGLFMATGSVGMVAATVVGFGAVILTRAGRNPMTEGAPDPDFGTATWDSEPGHAAGGFQESPPFGQGAEPGTAGDRPVEESLGDEQASDEADDPGESEEEER